MSLNLKIQEGLQKIHSVHITPADGFYTTQQIVENLEAYADTTKDKVPFATVYCTDASYALYTRVGSTATIQLTLAGYEFADKCRKVVCKIKFSSTTGVRYNDTGIYPTEANSYGNYTYAPREKAKIKFVSDRIGTYHSAIPKKYSGILNNQWVDFANGEIPFTDLAVLTNATVDDHIVVYNSGSTYYIYRYVGESAPVFEIASGSNYRAMNSQKDFRHEISSALISSSGKQLNDVVAIGSTERTDAFPISAVIAATFDIKDANNTVLFAKNTDITDFVLPTT